MMEQITNLNYLALAAAFFAFFVLGYLWYAVWFAKPYRISLGRENEALPNRPIFIIGPAVCSVFYVLASGLLIYALGIDGYGDVLDFSAIVGIGYLASHTFNIAINPNIPRPLLYGAVSGSYFLIGITIANFIIVAMK